MDGTISSKLNYRYDENDNLTEFTRFDGRQNAYTIKQYIQYNHGGLKTTEYGISGTAGQYKNLFKYNGQAELTEIKYYDANNTLSEVRNIKYSGNKREIFVYDGNGNLKSKIEKTVDSRGNTVEEAYIDASGEESKRFAYKFDKQNNLLEETKYYAGKLKEKILNKYEGTKLVEVIYVKPDGTQFTNNKYIYDNAGTLLEERWYSENKGEYSRKNTSTIQTAT
ncbi:MAG: hypothetical protein HC896_14275 [Bacteroidales bacterium]|nr:hypothetical protein [Bacteroidales bacterium]